MNHNTLISNGIDPNLPDHYRRKIKQLAYEYNRVFPLPYYFGEMIRLKKVVKIADIGSGPVCTLGNIWGDSEIKIYASDLRQPSYKTLIEKEKIKLLTPIEYQDMENLTYPDNFFDVVHCVNALDHTNNAQKALDEMKRVCKKDGYIYLRHAHNQRRAHKGNGHFWDASITGFSNGKIHINLESFISGDDGYFITSVFKKH